MKRLVVTRDASQDLDEISDYLLAQSIDAGDRFIAAFSKKCQYLAQYPYLGKSYSWIAPELTRLILAGVHCFLPDN